MIQAASPNIFKRMNMSKKIVHVFDETGVIRIQLKQFAKYKYVFLHEVVSERDNAPRGVFQGNKNFIWILDSHHQPNSRFGACFYSQGKSIMHFLDELETMLPEEILSVILFNLDVLS